MSEDYWFPFYVTRYQRDTMHLTAEQDGVYRRLIDHYMLTKRPLPDNDVALARIAGVDATSNALSIVRAYFKHCKDGLLYHKTCEKVLSEQAARKDVATDRAKKAAKKRWEKQGDNALSMPQAMLVDATYTNTYTNTNTNKDISTFSLQTEMNALRNEKKYKPDFELFWQKYPKTRIGNKDSAYNAWKKALTRSTEKEIMDGLQAYIGSDEVTRGFAKGAAAWLNDDRWKSDYSRKSVTQKPEPRYSETKKNVVTL